MTIALWHLHPIQKSSHYFPDKSVNPSLLKCFWSSVPKLVRSPSRHSLFCAVILRWGVFWKGKKNPNHKYCCLNCWKQSPASLAGIYEFYFLHPAPFLLSAQCQHEHFCCCTVNWTRELMWLKNDPIVLYTIPTADISRVLLCTCNLSRWSREIHCIFETETYNADLSAIQDHYRHKL